MRENSSQSAYSHTKLEENAKLTPDQRSKTKRKDVKAVRNVSSYELKSILNATLLAHPHANSTRALTHAQ